MIYPEDFEKKIGFDRIREKVNNNCLSSLGQEVFAHSEYISDPEILMDELGKVTEFQKLIAEGENFPMDHYYDLTPCLIKIRVEGSHPEVIELFNLKRSLGTIKAIYNFIKQKNRDKEVYPCLEKVSSRIKIFPFVLDSIDRILSKEGSIKDKASPDLSSIRDEIRKLNQSVTRKLQSVLKQSQADGLVEQGTTVAIRNGRGVIPVGAYDKNKISGLVHDQSASGKTVFVEPEAVVAMNNRLVELDYEEKREITKILIVFADGIRPYIDELLTNYSLLGELDYIRAKAIVGTMLNSVNPMLSPDEEMEWISAVHPLLYLAFKEQEDREVVPLDIRLDARDRILLISGPNAGGKSVCLKTVGLLQYMFQYGMTVPVKEGSRFRLFDNIFIDIGDEQSIDNDLSTYSSHLMNMKHFLKHSDNNSLILIDEFGTGTEPMLGAAIAESILSRFNESGLFGVLTTHYTNLKHFASSVDGIVNGAMMFDNHLLQPLFKLDIGKPGSSFAFEIARKIGLPEDVLAMASDKIGEEHINFDRHLKDILRDKRYWDKKRQNIRINNKRLDELIEQYEKEISNFKSERKEIISRAKTEAEDLLSTANKRVENTIREIKESQADKEKTRMARAKLEKVDELVKSDSIEDSRIEAKIKKLKEKETKVRGKEKPTEKKSEIKAENTESGPLKPGQFVKMDGTNTVGEVIDIKGTKIRVSFGNMISTVKAEKLFRVASKDYRRQQRSQTANTSLDWEVTARRAKFTPDIDVRGLRAEEALEVVRTLLDEAIMVQYANLRILHGKGDGILRHLIREFLSTADLVKDFHDENIEAGGSGVTIVVLDV